MLDLTLIEEMGQGGGRAQCVVILHAVPFGWTGGKIR